MRLVPPKGVIMKIYINRKAIECDGQPTLADVITSQNLDRPGIAAAVGGKAVPRSAWASTPLKEGDEIIVISAVCGG